MNSQDSGFFLTIGKNVLLAGAALLLLAAVLWTVGLCVCRPICALILLPAPLVMKLISAKLQKDIPMPAYFAALVMIALVTFALMEAPSGTEWAQPWAKGPEVSPKGSALHLRNVRDFDFRDTKDYDVRYLEEDFRLEDLCGVHLMESRRQGIMQDCDLLLSFVFNDGRSLVFGPEMRLPQGEQFNETQALYKGYGLLYMFGTEEDMLRLRTNLKHEYMTFHTLRLTHQQAQEMLAACARLAMANSTSNKAYPPFAGQYDGAMQSILRIALPQLPHALNEDVARILFDNEILGAKQGETWNTYQRRCAVGFNIAKEERATYAAELRRLTESPKLPELHAARHVQEESLAADRKRKNKADSGASKEATSYASTFTTGKGRALAADIPEPGERLTIDTRDYSDEEYNSDEPQEETEDTPAPAKDAIPEPKARMHADDMAAAAAAERREREKKDAAEGKFAKKGENTEEAAEPRSSVDYGEFITGRKRGGIRIIEKPKKAEPPHPLDPYKRRTPFDDEENQKKEEPKDTDDLTSKPAPIHF